MILMVTGVFALSLIHIFDGVKPVLLYPLLGIFLIGVIMQFVVELSLIHILKKNCQ